MKLDFYDPYSPRAAATWRTLEASAAPAYFLSWPWIENWLACVPPEQAPQLAVVSDAAGPRAAFFLGRRFQVRNRIVPTRAMFLNATGDTQLDSVCIEYNGLVGRDVPLDTLIDVLPSGWDELFLPGLHETALGGLDRVAPAGDYRVRIDRQVPVHFVKLERVRERDYLSLLSSQTRSQVRRAQREAAVTRVEIAADVDHAKDIFNELCTLHNARWQAKGHPGAFSDPWFCRLHQRLIERRLATGEIQLLRVRGSTGTIGCLYNFVHQRRVLQYQCGFASFSDPHRKPGFVCHTAAIEHAAAVGLDVYDFLGGNSRYKKSLSTDLGSLSWARVQRPRWRFFVEDQLRRLRAVVRSAVTSARIGEYGPLTP